MAASQLTLDQTQRMKALFSTAMSIIILEIDYEEEW